MPDPITTWVQTATGMLEVVMPAGDGATGPTGPPGPAGPTGPQGPAAPPAPDIDGGTAASNVVGVAAIDGGGA